MDHRGAGLVATHARVFDREQAPDLVGDRREYLLWRGPVRHQRRDPPQRGLLVSQPGEPGAALRIRDRHREQLRELGETCLGVRRQSRPVQRRTDGHHPPHVTVDDDRRADRRVKAAPPPGDTDRA
jgi:hypothetical protein